MWAKSSQEKKDNPTRGGGAHAPSKGEKLGKKLMIK